ncbi:hypothetical protein Nepgr_033569 [Nepenthes gracilis]|uniref:Uncharacterized protein n=1 Tax=Nepenthes gracilis TaxID=150966 RepID=A0AAD3Y8H3_NEPGR|nr:hypothetical protein Nepgr_033569 [Nepenthes gracilis]
MMPYQYLVAVVSSNSVCCCSNVGVLYHGIHGFSMDVQLARNLAVAAPDVNRRSSSYVCDDAELRFLVQEMQFYLLLILWCPLWLISVEVGGSSSVGPLNSGALDAGAVTDAPPVLSLGCSAQSPSFSLPTEPLLLLDAPASNSQCQNAAPDSCPKGVSWASVV